MLHRGNENKETTDSVLLKELPSTHSLYSHTLCTQPQRKSEKKNKNVMYAFKWYFYGFCTIQPLVKIYI